MVELAHDQPTQAIAAFTAGARHADLSASIRAAVVRHLLDAVGCALGGFWTEPCRIVRAIAATSFTEPGCTAFGLSRPVTAEQAVFANTTMVRQLDLNDSRVGGGHPSDIVPAIFAAVELAGGDGRDLVRGIHVGYEVFHALSDAYPGSAAGFDGGIFLAVAAAMGAGSVLSLGVEPLAHAVAMSLAPGLALRFTRHGALSQWKGSAGAYGVMTGLFVVRLAAAGMTGPEAPFEGVDGVERFLERVCPVEPGVLRDGRSAVERTIFKRYPAQVNTQGLIGPLAAVRERIDVDAIERIEIDTYERAWSTAGGGGSDHEQRWHPSSRETADHSIPYITAMALLDGDVTPASYAPARLADPAVHALMARTTVVPRDDLTAKYPAEANSEVRITLSDGQVVLAHSEIPPGDQRNPMTDAQLSAKFRRGAEGALDEAEAEALEGELWSVEEVGSIDRLRRAFSEIGAGLPAQVREDIRHTDVC